MKKKRYSSAAYAINGKALAALMDFVQKKTKTIDYPFHPLVMAEICGGRRQGKSFRIFFEDNLGLIEGAWLTFSEVQKCWFFKKEADNDPFLAREEASIRRFARQKTADFIERYLDKRALRPRSHDK